jgi:hypothetical protein
MVLGSGSPCSAVEIALWDLIGKAANQPLYKLWGGTKDRVMPYSSMFRLGPAQERAEQALELKRAGWKAIKLKSHYPTIKEDVAQIEAVRRACGHPQAARSDSARPADPSGRAACGHSIASVRRGAVGTAGGVPLMHRGIDLCQVSPTHCGDAGGGVGRRGMTIRPMMDDVLRLRCPARQCDDVARLVVGARVPGWGQHQARPEAEARYERTL